MKKILLILIIIFINKLSTAQEATMTCDNLTTIEKATELIHLKQKEGFVLMIGGFYKMQNNALLPIMVNLEQNRVYHFIVVGQPDLDFLEVGLGHDAFGTDEIRDRIRKKRDHTYFTEFTYLPAFTGNYLLSVTEKCKGRPEFCSAIYLMAKPHKVVLE